MNCDYPQQFEFAAENNGQRDLRPWTVHHGERTLARAVNKMSFFFFFFF